MTAFKGIPSVNDAQFAKGTVLEVDSNNIALVRLGTGQQVRVRADMLRGKSAAPKAGETWVLDQAYGSGWMFAIPINYTGGDQTFTAPTLGTGWSNAGSPYLSVGYIMDSEGWVTLRGRLKAGTGVDQVAFTLPEGYRPGGTSVFLVPVGTGTAGTVTVEANGDVSPGVAVDTSLEPIRFLAAG